MSESKFPMSSVIAGQGKTFTPSAIAIVSRANSPLLIRTSLDEVDREEATRLIYLLHASLDIVDEKSEQHTTRDNFLGVLYQCEQYKIYGSMSTTKVKILLMLSLKMSLGQVPRENDIRQMLKNIHRAYIDSTAMNPFYKPHEPIKSKRLDAFLDTIFAFPQQTQLTVDTDNPSGELNSQAVTTLGAGNGVGGGVGGGGGGGTISPMNPTVQTV